MTGNGRRGVVCRTSKKSVGGPGGQKCGLRGKGPAPKTEDRAYHAAHKRANEKCCRDFGRHERREDGAELVVGCNPVVGCLHARMPVAALIVALGTDNDERLQESVRIVNSRGIPIREVPHYKLDTMIGNIVHQGVGLQIPLYKYSSVEGLIDSVVKTGEPRLTICLDNIADPRNLGAVIRSVAAFGGHGVVIPEWRPATTTGMAWHAPADAAARLSVARATNMTRSPKQFQRAGYQIIGLDAGGDYAPDTYNGITPVVVIVGSEGRGLSHLVCDTCDTIMSIPMIGWVESLNAFVATDVTLSEFARQRRAKNSRQCT